MAADLWQLANGWELVDWSLNVGGEPPAPTPGGRRPIKRQRMLVPESRVDRDAEALAVALLLLT